MALWGKTNVVGSGGSVSLNYSTGVVTGAIDGAGAGTSFGSVGAAKTGDIIRFGSRGPESSTGGTGTFFGDAVVVSIASIASSTSVTIASTAGLSGAAIANTSYQLSEQPDFVEGDSKYSEKNSDYSSHVYGVSAVQVGDAAGTVYETSGGWVGVQTYIDSSGALRVKSEVLVAMSGITTGNLPAYPNIELAN